MFASAVGFFLNPRAILIFLIPFFPLPASSNSPSNFDDSNPIFSDSMSASVTSKLTGTGIGIGIGSSISVFVVKDWTKNGISFLTTSPDSGNSLEHSVEENPRFFRPNFQVLRNKIWSIKRSANPWSYFLRPHFSELGKFWCRKPILGQ